MHDISLNQQHIREFQALWHKRYGESLTETEANHKALALIELITLTTRHRKTYDK